MISSTGLAQQAPPDSISFQGYVTDSLGVPYDTMVTVTTKLYKGGTQVYTQTHANTQIKKGVFNVIIGPLGTLAFDRRVDLGVTVGGDSEITPRTPLTIVPYAQSLQAMRVFPPPPPSESYYEAPNIIGGLRQNYVLPGVVGATIGGGGASFGTDSLENSVGGYYGTIGGGFQNAANGSTSWIGGGENNKAPGNHSVIAGGKQNVSSGGWSAIGGGQGNTASGTRSTISGGSSNVASGPNSMIPGGASNAATKGYSFAAGYRAKANHSGTFVWADSASNNGMPEFASTRANQFLIRASGGVGINTNVTSNNSLTVSGGAKIDILRFAGGGGSSIVDVGSNILVQTLTLSPLFDDQSRLGRSANRWEAVWAVDGMINTSDARAKTDVHNLSYGLDEVLDLRPVSFRWKKRPESGPRMGLIAQEVAKIVPELIRGDGDAMLGMNYGELVPILIKAIQQQQALIETQRTELDDLRTAHSDQDERLAALEARLRP